MQIHGFSIMLCLAERTPRPRFGTHTKNDTKPSSTEETTTSILHILVCFVQVNSRIRFNVSTPVKPLSPNPQGNSCSVRSGGHASFLLFFFFRVLCFLVFSWIQ